MTERHYPDKLEIVPLAKPPHATIRVPGSKSITNRALVLAALASPNGPARIKGMLVSEDTEIMVVALRQLGFKVSISDGQFGSDVTITTTNPLVKVPARHADLFVGNSGTSMRFLTALVSLGWGAYRLDGIPRMRERPIEDLLNALRQLGVDARSENANGCPPVVVQSRGLPGGSAVIQGNVSSQFLSALLMVAPLANGDITIEVAPPVVSRPYLYMTTNLMAQIGVEIVPNGFTRFEIRSGQKYAFWRDLEIEPDASAASYFFGAAAILQGWFRSDGLYASEARGGGYCWIDGSGLQGDVAFLNPLVEMGCVFKCCLLGAELQGGRLRGIDIDMNAISDTVMTLAAVACFAEGPTTIRNVAHIRHKESDRIAAMATELRKVGAEVEEFPDGMRITPRPLHGAEIDTYNDHRIAMSMALIGLKVPGIVIKNPGCVAKTYPGFWDDLEKLREGN